MKIEKKDNSEDFSKGKILTTQQLAKELSVSERTIYNWRSMGVIPFIKLGNVVRFDYRRVVAALNQEGELV